MSELIPEDMDEVRSKVNELSKKGKHVSIETVIEKSVSDLFQMYLDSAEEGHYDTGELDKNTITVYGIGHVKQYSFNSKGTSFVEDFKNNSIELLLRLEDEADKIARN
ncbi:hypothetical protein M2S00_02670 [Apilactobacillus sp. TMW 2.2459]|uniref:Uncharacterized protein n=1 Tax=Apilactobacillus xinyiensis TaxID=2841032 RepID=A0ABT0I0P8_9LACO|nr:hypothetical protein [Apilactobacillus xinyiensis]MCK8624409.1 hypothetical protein [Apilactobacillus xinyiensis]MCL0312002.1 hypothetical protein [Apilactobacillus xinyiensis]MCL0329600.1 hypothetical protein [Apilactobacillus xinyiensis]